MFIQILSLIWFYGISTIESYLMPNPFLNIQIVLFQTILMKYRSTNFTKKIVSYQCVFACVFLNLYTVKMLTHNFYKEMPALHIGFWILNKVKMLICSMKPSWLSLVKENSYWLSICISNDLAKHIFYIWYVFECLFQILELFSLISAVICEGIKDKLLLRQ